MKKIFISVTVIFISLLFYTTAFAGSTGMPTSFKVDYKSINANQIQISWEPIPNVMEYRICVANNCGGPDETKVWITIDSTKTNYIFDLPVGKTERFFVHAWMQQSATKWTWTDDRPNLLGLKWDNGPGYVNYTNNWVDPNAITTTTTTTTVPVTTTTTTTTALPSAEEIYASRRAKGLMPSEEQIEQENEEYESSCASRTWTVNGNCVVVKTKLKPKAKYIVVSMPFAKEILSTIKTGAICKNGSIANTGDPLTCLKQGGVRQWIYLPPTKTNVIKKFLCLINNNTNKHQYPKNCTPV